MEKKEPFRPRPASGVAPEGKGNDRPPTQPDPELDALWRLAQGLDLGSRSVLEVEVLMWRICRAKSLSSEVTQRALNDVWENDQEPGI